MKLALYLLWAAPALPRLQWLRDRIGEVFYAPKQAADDFSDLTYTVKWCAIIIAASFACLTIRLALRKG